MNTSKTKIIASIVFIFVAAFSIAQEYNVSTWEYDESRGISPLREQLWVNPNPASWILDLPNGSARSGDRIVILETKAHDQTPYISGYSVNGQVYIGILNEEESWRDAIMVDYYDSGGNKVAQFWQNRQNPGLFDISRRFIEFFLPGEMEDYTISSHFGERPKPIVYWGGPDIDFHNGIDFIAERGIPIISPVSSGRFTIGYSPLAGKYIFVNHIRYVYERVDGRRQRVRKEYTIGIFHLDGWSEEILRLQMNNSRYQRWFIDIIQRDAEQILLYLIETGSERLSSAVWSPLPSDEVIAFSGWTGKSTNAHVHFEIANVEGGVRTHLDPAQFFNRYMITRGISEWEIRNLVSEFQRITGN